MDGRTLFWVMGAPEGGAHYEKMQNYRYYLLFSFLVKNFRHFKIKNEVNYLQKTIDIIIGKTYTPIQT